ncbi:MAG: RNA polymerase sigma factor [Actinomycetota bacterium]
MEELLLLIHPQLLRYLTGMVGDHAEDVLQDTLLQICRKLRYLKEPLAFKAWSYRIAARFASAHLRRERQWKNQVRDEALIAGLVDPTTEKEPEWNVSELQDFAKRLSPAGRSVLLMHYCAELSLDEIASILNVPLGTVKSRLAYGLETLRRLISSQGAKI